MFGRRVPGDGGGIRDYVAVGDVVRANLWALREAPDGLVIDIGTGVGTSTAELLTQLASLLGIDPDVDDLPPRSGDLERSVLDTRAQVREIGEPMDLRTGLARTLAWFRRD
jgi:UDP-glucose 4-epimerase